MQHSTTSPDQRKKRLLLAAQILIFLLAIGARLLPGARMIDDSFITFRYVRNILAGNGFTFNPGEHVLGTTTPFYTILLTGLGSFTGGPDAPFPLLALLTSALADALSCLLLFHLGQRMGSWRAGLAASLAWSVAPFSVTFAIGGLETSIYILFLIGAASAYLDQRPILTALLAALALLTRPDALILVALLASARLFESILAQRKETLESSGVETKLPDRDHFSLQPGGSANRKISAVRNIVSPLPGPSAGVSNHQAVKRNSWLTKLAPEAAAFCLPLVPWLIFSTLSFGSPVPHSIAAKSVAYHLPPTAALVRLLQHFSNPFMEEDAFGSGAIAVGLVLYPFLFAIGARLSMRNNRRAWPVLLYPWAYFAAFALANPLIFRWYLSPPLPFYILTILIGAEKLVLDLTRIRRKASQPAMAKSRKQSLRTARSMITPIALGMIVILPFSLNLLAWDLHPDHGPDRPAPAMAWYKLELLYRQAAGSIAEEINQRPARQIWLAAGDVGVLGFFTPAQILDTVGLNSPQSLPYYPLDPTYYAINYAIPPGLINDLQPDYLVILEIYGRNGLLKDARFSEAYRLRSKIATDIYGSDGMLIFEKRSRQ